MMVLGIDPGLANFGWAILDVATQRVESMGVTRTKHRAGKKGDVSAASDLHARGKIIASALAGLPEVAMICAESISFPRHASSAAKLARAWGVVDAISDMRAVPLVQASPKEIKLAVTGAASASKDAVIASIREHHESVAMTAFCRTHPKGVHEHAFDAIGAAIACWDSPAMLLLRRLA